MAERNLLFVEGPDDLHVFRSLLGHHHLQAQFVVEAKEGVTNVLQAVRVQLLALDEDIPLNRLGIVVDADTDLAARWQAIRNILVASGYQSVPAAPDPAGTVILQADRPVVGIWLMPDNHQHGMLEDFIRLLVPPGDLLWQRAEDCLNQTPPAESRFPQERRGKALIHTWLAWQAQPGRPLGQAITARYLDADAPHAQQLVAWLHRLLTPGAA